MIIAKIGGALFAPKDKENFIDVGYLNEINNFFLNNFAERKQILLHGTGNVGHGFVKKNGLNDQNRDFLRKDLDELFARFDSVFKGYERFVAEDILEQQIDFSNYDKIVSGGDIDKNNNIISSDDLFAYFIDNFDVENTIMLTDIDGVFDQEKNIIKQIDKGNIGKLNFWEKPGDVTGSMQKKVQKLFTYNTGKSRKQKNVWIVNGRNMRNLGEIIKNNDGIGTKVII